MSEPLTLEQLREMDDRPVKVRNLENPESEKLPTGVITMCDPNDSDNGVDVGCGFYSIRDYGRTWVAYPYRMIYREAWEPCEMCETCSNCWGAMNQKYWLPCNKCVEFSEFSPVGYCRYCGRPLTEDAWAEREKQIGGF